MKKPYAPSTLKRKLGETGIPKPVRDKLHLYLVACANFYKILNVDEVWEAIQTTERRLAKKELKDILNSGLINSARFYVAEEFHRQVQDDLLGEDDEKLFVSKDAFYEELAKRGDEFEEKEMEKTHHIAEILTTPLISGNYMFGEGDYELTRDDFDKLMDIMERSCDRYVVFREDEVYDDGDPAIRYLADINSLIVIEDGEPVDMNFDELDEILSQACEKPLFIPEDLLNYIYENYFEKTPEAKAMEDFLKKAFFKNRDMYDEDAIVDLDIMMTKLNRIMRKVTVSPTEDINQATQMLEDEGYVFSGFDQVKKFLQVFQDMSNNTRKPANKGNTPMGMVLEGNVSMPEGISFGPGIQEMIRSGKWDAAEMKRDIMTEASLPIKLRENIMREIDRALEPGEERIINATGTIVKGKKIKPNEPCPCGSGRKYKHCCGRNS